jgi:hypothetical protein
MADERMLGERAPHFGRTSIAGADTARLPQCRRGSGDSRGCCFPLRPGWRRSAAPRSCVTCNMGSVTSEASSAQRVQAHRRRLRAQGLRPVQIWVPDTRAPEFIRQAHEQSEAVAASDHTVEDQAFVDAVSWDSDE